jgi:hypothetical protein
MSLHHPLGWDLPPGCTDADIEREMTPEEICEESQDRLAEKADRMRDEEIDRQMGL